MKLTIDTKLLDQQLALCTIKANNASDSLERDLFTGLENLLGELACALENNEEIEIEATEPAIPNGRMTIRELMGYEIDVDVANNVIDSLGICLVCPMKLTEEGEREWGDVMNYIVDVYGEDNFATCIVDDDHNTPWKTKAKRLDQFLWAAAGYCAEEDYDKWFEPSDE